ncbi:MAG: hypothetical protein RI841_00415 [Halomonas sp.]|uniref:hypothetical protein n=1 Tax=Halomonas sp. TaxID=1486246 RepID=UPI00286FF9E8|nr:hypothetical protein [Halomonas sp.]MDR9437954.1 hypothetical protein [Halomonas sp.]
MTTRTLEHIALVSITAGIATLTGVPIGIAITKSVLYAASIIVTIPSIALFGIMIPVLSLIGHGIGYVPAVFGLFVATLLPITRNTYQQLLKDLEGTYVN